jgi:hypothetical protein
MGNVQNMSATFTDIYIVLGSEVQKSKDSLNYEWWGEEDKMKEFLSYYSADDILGVWLRRHDFEDLGADGKITFISFKTGNVFGSC